MTVSSNTRTAGPFTGTGVLTTYPFAFKVFSTTDVLGVQTTDLGVDSNLINGTDFTVVLNSDQNANPGGTISYVPNAGILPLNYKLTFTSNLNYFQTLLLTNLGGFLPTVINDALDRCVILIQQTLRKANAALQFPLSDGTALSTTLPTLLLRANKLLAFGADGSLGVSNQTLSQIESGSTTATAQAAIATAAASTATGAAGTATTQAGLAQAAALAMVNLWCGTTGTGDAIVLTPSPAVTGNGIGQRYRFVAAANNTLPNPTAAVSGKPALTLKKSIGGALVGLSANDIVAAVAYDIEQIDASTFQLMDAATFGRGASVASASTIDLNPVTGDFIIVTGAVGINTINLQSGRRVMVYFSGAIALAAAYSPYGAAYTTTAGDTIVYRGDGSNLATFIEGFKPVSAAVSRASSGAAASGSNSDITALTALATTARNTSSLTAINGATLQNSMLGGFINKFRNPGFDIAQRGSPITVVAGAPAYTLDGWIISCTGANVTVTQDTSFTSTGGLGRYSALTITGQAGVTGVTIKQRIESWLARELDNGVATFQWAVANTSGASVTPQISINKATALDNFTGVSAILAATNLQAVASASGGVEAYAYNFASGDTLNGIEVIVDLGGALNGAGKGFSFSLADARNTPGVTAGLVSAPPQPEIRPFPVELALSQRYFEKSFQYSTIPAQNVADVSGAQIGMQIVGASATALYTINFKVSKRATPSMVFFNPVAANAQIRNGTGSTDFTGTAATNISQVNTGVSCTSPAGSALSNAIYVHWTASAEL